MRYKWWYVCVRYKGGMYVLGISGGMCVCQV